MYRLRRREISRRSDPQAESRTSVAAVFVEASKPNRRWAKQCIFSAGLVFYTLLDHPKKREDCVQHEAESVSASSLKINRFRNRWNSGEAQWYQSLKSPGIRLNSVIRYQQVAILSPDY